MDHASLFMIEIWLELRGLVNLGRALHLPVQQVDLSYITHCALRELFGDKAPGPFSVENTSGRHIRILAYSSVAQEELKAGAQAFASPMIYDIADWERFRSKPMPTLFPRATRLGFELRACPVVRKSSDGQYHRAGAEVDAFLSRVWEINDPNAEVDREKVYRDWLSDQFDRLGGAVAHTVRLERFSLDRIFRRDHQASRHVKTIKRPSATLAGELEVLDSGRFTDLLRRGIGRHRAFGFGMLKIRRPGG